MAPTPFVPNKFALLAVKFFGRSGVAVINVNPILDNFRILVVRTTRVFASKQQASFSTHPRPLPKKA
jgi:hypothetical protein